MGVDPKRTVAELEELRELTGDANGAHDTTSWEGIFERARERGSEQ